MMKQHYLVVDLKYCHDCNNCFVACKDEHVDNSWMPYTDDQPRHGHRWMNIQRRERGQAPRVDVCFLAMPCQHCADAPCIKAHPDCISRREDGIVMIDPEKARGKKDLLDSCPYGAIYWNEVRNVPQKCTLCAHLLDDGWGMVRCAHGCPTGALQYYNLTAEEMAAKVAAEGLENYRADLGTKPNVYYKNLHRFTKNFITGAVIKNNDCLENATVTLKGGGKSMEQHTDYFGEFKFDALEEGEYALEVNGVPAKTVQLETSLNIGEIFI